MPVYNLRTLVAQALESITTQSVTDLEVIVVDDGSTDGGGEVLARAAAGDPRVRVLTRPHQGIVAAMNAGLAASSAPFVARMDGDDISHPRRLERQLALLAESPSVGAMDCRVELAAGPTTGRGMREYVDWLNSLTTWDDLRRALFVESPLAHPAVTMRREALEAAGGYRESEGPEDYSLWLRMVEAGYLLAKLPEVLFVWRDLPQRLTRTSPRYSEQQMAALKAHHLPRLVPRVRQGIQVWGAGRTGRRFMKHARQEGLDIVRIFDIDPRKLGRNLHGASILPLEMLVEHRELLTLVALGTRRAKGVVARWMAEHGFAEEEDFIYVS